MVTFLMLVVILPNRMRYLPNTHQISVFINAYFTCQSTKSDMFKIAQAP